MKTIVDLRAILFETLDAPRDKTNPMDIARAKAITDVAQTVINSATVEVKHLQVTGQTADSGFLGSDADNEKKSLPGVTLHRLK